MTDTAFRCQDDPASLWRLVSEKLQQELPRQSYLTWFKPLSVLSFDGSALVLRVPSHFYYEWIESHYNGQLSRAVAAVVGDGVELSYSVDAASAPAPDIAPVKPIPADPPNRYEAGEGGLNRQYQFDNFVEGDCNRFARAAAVTLAMAPGKTSYNPLLIYGGSGLGKTHLMQAIGNYILDHKLARKALYVTGEKFTADFIKAIQSGRSESFSRIYRHVDVLLLDDVQFFMAKDKTQQEFFHTFNSLHQDGKQLVFSSDRPPHELEGFDQRLVSRLQWGLVSELRPPELETRIAILKNRAQEENVPLPDEVAGFIANHITDNVRKLQGALIKMMAQASLLGREISVDLAREIVKELEGRIIQTISVEQIQDLVAREFGVPVDMLRSRTRKREVARARQMAMYLATEYTDTTLKGIGLQFGGRDHSTVIHARETVCQDIKNNHSEADLVMGLRRKIEFLAI